MDFIRYLYNLTATASACSSSDQQAAAAYDALSTNTGFRSLRYTADEGFFLNDQHYKVPTSALSSF
jgi:hypothetical protein